MSHKEPLLHRNIFTSITTKVESWITFTLTIFLLGFFFFPSSSKHNTFFYLSVCIPVFLLLPVYYKKIRPNNILIISTLVFIFYLFLNSLWSIHYSTPQSLKYLRYSITLYCLISSCYIVVYKIKNYFNLLFPAIIVVGFFHSLYGIFDHFINLTTPLLTRYNDPIDSAMRVGLLLLTCIWLSIESSSWKQKLIYLCLSLPFIAIILLSKSRGPQLALFITLPLIAYYQNISLKKLILPSLILLIAFALVFIFTDISHIVFNRGLSAPYRMDIWLTAFNESIEHFWIGQGASHKPPLLTDSGTFNHSHNILLSIFRMGGIIAVLLFSLQFILCFYSGQKNKSSNHRLWIVWLFFGVVCLMTNGKYPLSRPSSVWMAYWIPIAFICASYSHFLSKNHEK